jgi:exodeoxyribonuclease VII large subunit
LPVVTGVGHETDVTIADLVADHRAATPSAAAETTVPSCGQLRGELGGLERRLREALRGELVHKRERAQRQTTRLAQLSPGLRVSRMRQEMQARRVRLSGALLAGVTARQRDLERRRGALALHSPLQALPLHRERLASRAERLGGGMRALVGARRRRVEGVQGRLAALSPLRVIERGYSITVDEASGRVVRAAAAVAPGAILRTRLAAGSLRSRVLEVTAADPEAERMYDEAPGPPSSSEEHDG